MNILLATPAYDGSVTTVYLRAIVALLENFRSEVPDAKIEVATLSPSTISHARNAFATRVLEEPSYTHLLFIDADMGFAPRLIRKMVDLDKPVVGAICPQRTLDYGRFHEVSRSIADPKLARLVAMGYVGADELVPDENGRFQIVKGGFVRATRVGTGIMLVKREALETMRARFPELWTESRSGTYYESMGAKTGVFQCFETMPESDGAFSGEDMAFCRRWGEGCGGEIWACVSETVIHVGRQNFIGNYLVQLQHQIGAAKASS